MGCGFSRENTAAQPNDPRLPRSKERPGSERPKSEKLTSIYHERITSPMEVKDECLSHPGALRSKETYSSQRNSQSQSFKESYEPRKSADLQTLERSRQEKSAHRTSLRGSEHTADRSDDFRRQNRTVGIDDLANISEYIESKTDDGKCRLHFMEDGTCVEAETFIGREKNGTTQLVTRHLIRHSKCLHEPNQGELLIAVYQKLPLTGRKSLSVQPVDLTLHETKNEGRVPYVNVIDETKPELVLLENQMVQSEQSVTNMELPERYQTRQLSPRYIYMGVKPQRKDRYSPSCWTLPVRQPKIPVVRSRGIKQKHVPQCCQRSLGCIKPNTSDVHSSICQYHRKDGTIDNDSVQSDGHVKISETKRITHKESPRKIYENTRFLVEPVINRVYVAPGCNLPNVYEDIAQTVKSVHGSSQLAVGSVQQSTNSSVHIDPILMVNPEPVEADSERSKISNLAHSRKPGSAKRIESFGPKSAQRTPLVQPNLSEHCHNPERPCIYPPDSLNVTVLGTGTSKIVVQPSSRCCSLYTVHTAEMNEPCTQFAVEEWTVPVFSRNTIQPAAKSRDSESGKEIQRTSRRCLFDRIASFRKQDTQSDTGEVRCTIRTPSTSSPVRAHCDPQIDSEQLTAPDTSSEMSYNSHCQQWQQQQQQQHRPSLDDSPTQFIPLLQSTHGCTCRRQKVDASGTKCNTLEFRERLYPETGCMNPRPLRCGTVSPIMEYRQNMVLVSKSPSKNNQLPVRRQCNANSGANIKLLSTSKQSHSVERLSPQQVAHGSKSRDWSNRNSINSSGFLPPIETTPTTGTYYSTGHFRGPRSTKEFDKHRKSPNSLSVSLPRLQHVTSSDRHGKRVLNQTSASISKPTEVITNSKVTGKKRAKKYDILIVNPPK